MAAMVALPPNNMSRMPPTTNIDHHNTLYKPIGTRLRGNFTETKNVNIFTNGDVFHAPRKFVINKKKTPDWEHLLDVITDGLNPYFGAVRHLYTPNNGSEFVSTGDFVEKLHNNQTLVAGGREKFRHKGYLDFGKKPMKDKPPKLDRLPPKRLNVSSKLYNTEMCTVISVFRNNQPGDWAQVKVTPRMKKYGMGHILDEITDKFKWKFNYNTAVRKLYTTNGVRILETKDIVKSGAYVACGLEPFKPSDSYIPEINNAIRQNKKQQPNRIQTKPEPNKTYAAIHKDRTQQKTNNSPRTELHVINPRRQPGSYRPYPPTERETFPNKPVKHKRDTRPGAPSTEADDNARGPVFKARHGRVQAQEVPEDEDTKVDLPFDQVPAETVDTESILDVPADQTEPDVRKSSPMEAEVKTFSNVNSPTPSQGSRVFESKKSVPKEEAFGTSQSPVLTPTSPKNKSPILRTKSREEYNAATKIQSHVRGYLTRRDVAKDNEKQTQEVLDTSSKANSMVLPQEDQPVKQTLPQTTYKANSMSQEQAEAFETEPSKSDVEIPKELPLISSSNNGVTENIDESQGIPDKTTKQTEKDTDEIIKSPPNTPSDQTFDSITGTVNHTEQVHSSPTQTERNFENSNEIESNQDVKEIAGFDVQGNSQPNDENAIPDPDGDKNLNAHVVNENGPTSEGDEKNAGKADESPTARPETSSPVLQNGKLSQEKENAKAVDDNVEPAVNDIHVT